MADFMEKIISSRKDAQRDKNKDCLFLYQTVECMTLVEECMLQEGMTTPELVHCNDALIPDLLNGKDHPLIFIEITINLMDTALKIARLISHEARVVLIGRVDSITAHRTLEELGFYYLLWPAVKNDVGSFLKDLQNDLNRNLGPQQSRAAMRIGVVAIKGGCGCTMISSELAYALTSETGQDVIIADHGYTGSNMHIMLGKKDLERRPIGTEGIKHHTLSNMLDPVGVQSQLARVGRGISYLGFESTGTRPDEMREYTHNMLATQLRVANFIIEDYSGSVKFYPDPKWLNPITDCVVLVTTPTLSALNETRNFLKLFNEEQEMAEKPTRLILVLNNVTPQGKIERKDIEQFFQRPIDIEFPYQKKTEELLTSGKRFIDHKTALTMPFQHLARQILGKPVEEKVSLKARIKEVKERLLPMIAKKQKFEPGLDQQDSETPTKAVEPEISENETTSDQQKGKVLKIIRSADSKISENEGTST